MASNTIVIGNGKIKDTQDAQPVLNDIAADTQTTSLATVQESVQEPLYETVWGNDNSILKMLDDKQRADRRFYARAIYMHEVKCTATLDNEESKLTLLTEPIAFMIIDISMGGIGIVSEYSIDIGTILVFNLTLDNIPYEVQYEVIYCFQNDGKFRAGLKIAQKDKQFIRHLKILVARLTLESTYGKGGN